MTQTSLLHQAGVALLGSTPIVSAAEWFALHRDVRYTATTNRWLENVHRGGLDSQERLHNLEAQLKERAWLKVSQYGLRDHGNEWVTKDQVELGSIRWSDSDDLAVRRGTVSFAVRDSRTGVSRARGSIELSVVGAEEQLLHYEHYTIQNLTLERKSMGEVGVDTASGMFGERLERGQRQAHWHEMQKRGLVLGDFPG